MRRIFPKKIFEAAKENSGRMEKKIISIFFQNIFTEGTYVT